MFISWSFDFNFDISKTILVKEGILDKRVKLFEYLECFNDIASVTSKYKEKIKTLV